MQVNDAEKLAWRGDGGQSNPAEAMGEEETEKISTAGKISFRENENMASFYDIDLQDILLCIAKLIILRR